MRVSTAPIVRLAHPLAFAAFLEHVGAPSESYFRRHGLPVYCERPDGFVPLRRAWSFFHAAAQREDPMLGWHVGRFVGNHNLNRVLLRKLGNSPTLYQALKMLVRLASAEASHLRLGILELDDDILLYAHYPDMKGEPGYTQSQAYILEVLVDLVRHFVGRHWVPDTIGVEYPTVTAVMREHFPGSRVLTHQHVGCVAVPRSRLHTAARGKGAQEGDDSLVLTKGFDYVDTLRALLRTYLADGYPSARTAASLMDSSERTLARRLEGHGLTYGALIDEVRFSAARDSLCDTDARVVDIAGSVGFGDPAHFARMFRRIGGLSPRNFRKAVQLSRTGAGLDV